MAERAPKAREDGPQSTAENVERLEGFLAGGRARGKERLVYQKIRLGILSALAVNHSLTFTELKALLHATDGNLAVHARKLEDAGLVECSKSFEGRIPKTEYRLTAEGRQSLEKYLDHMEALLQATRGALADGGT